MYRNLTLSIFGALTLLSVYFILQLRFSFNFEDFFPKGDPDLAFFEEFKKNFEPDDNFLLIGVRNKSSVFNQNFLERFDSLNRAVKKVDNILDVQSITTISYPIITPLFATAVPAVHIDDPSKYASDKKILLEDERFVGNLISKDAKSVVLFAKTKSKLSQSEAENLMNTIQPLVNQFGFDETHYLGIAYFQKELVAMQKREIIVSAIISNVLVVVILYLIFNTFWGTVISMGTVVLGMILFFGVLGAMGRELSAMAALYPVLMVIVGTSDVIHILSKYIDELKKGFSKNDAIKNTVKEIGLAVFLTSFTTAVGFATLYSSKVQPIKDFGINSAIGILIAYLTVIFFTTAVLSFFSVEKIVKFRKTEMDWEKLLIWLNHHTKYSVKTIVSATILFLIVCFIGISQITTNYRIESNLPIGKAITKDFQFFEKHFIGFRPFEIAITAKGNYTVNDYEVVQEVAKIEEYLKKYTFLQGVTSITTIYKSINRATKANRAEEYKFPKSESQFLKFQKQYVSKIPSQTTNILVSKDAKQTRISGRMLDVGADNMRKMSRETKAWIAANIDDDIVTIQQTGTSLMVDKNAQYIRDNLLWGLGLSVLIVGIIMVLLFKTWRMLIVSLVPNLIPMLLAGAVLGFFNIELESGVAIVFSIIFGIAVDDTIHFLSKFKLVYSKNVSIDEAIKITFMETGKAMCLTTIILFFGFLVLMFSIHPPSITVGLLISITLFSALLCDLFLLPILIRWFFK